MKNPYLILGIQQDATAVEIIRAQATAMRDKKYNIREIAEARNILSKPDTRLATDFTFPIIPEELKFKEIKTTVTVKDMNVNDINPNKYNSL